MIDVQTMDAMKVYAKVNGLDANELAMERYGKSLKELEDELELNYGKKKAKAKEKKDKARRRYWAMHSDDDKIMTEEIIPMKDYFRNLAKEYRLTVGYNSHDIKYKEQLWGIPQRNVMYNLRLIKTVGKGKSILNIIKPDNIDYEIKKMSSGDTRYMEIVTDESVLHHLKTIGYIKFEVKNNKIIKTILLNSNLLKNNNANPDKIMKDLNRIVTGIKQ